MKAVVCFALVPLLTGIAVAQKVANETTASSSDTSGAKAGSKSANNEMQTQSFKGTLADASCAASSAPNSSSAAAAESGKSKKHADANGGAACSPSANTSLFALKTNDGRTLKFDLVGNQRAQDAFKNKKKWSEDASAGKPIRAKVSGVLTGDTLTVMSVD